MARRYDLSDRFGLYRNTQEGWIAGVCAGMADRIGIKPVWLRLAAGLLASGVINNYFVPLVVAYGVLAFVLKPRAGVAAPASAAGVQMAFTGLAESVSAPFGAPANPVGNLMSRFAALEARLGHLEAAVMSEELSLRRKFKDLGA